MSNKSPIMTREEFASAILKGFDRMNKDVDSLEMKGTLVMPLSKWLELISHHTTCANKGV